MPFLYNNCTQSLFPACLKVFFRVGYLIHAIEHTGPWPNSHHYQVIEIYDSNNHCRHYQYTKVRYLLKQNEQLRHAPAIPLFVTKGIISLSRVRFAPPTLLIIALQLFIVTLNKGGIIVRDTEREAFRSCSVLYLNHITWNKRSVICASNWWKQNGPLLTTKAIFTELHSVVQGIN